MTATSTWVLADGDTVQVTPVSGGFTAQFFNSGQIAQGPAFSAIQPQLGLFTFENLTALTTGGYAIDYIYNGALLPGFFIESATFNAEGVLLGQSQVSAPSLENGDFPVTTGQIHPLPNGGFVESWTDAPYGPNGSGASNQIVVREFNALGDPVNNPQVLGALFLTQPALQVNADGSYVVSWQSPSGPRQQTFDQPPTAPAQSTTAANQDDSLIAGQAVTLAASAGWAGAALLSNGQLTLVSVQDGGYGSHVAATQTYDSVGNETNSAALMGYAAAGATLSPQIASLGAGGFYEVSYAGSSNYEIYNAADHLVFAHNAYTNPNAQFTALQSGGYVVTDFPDQAMGVYDSQGNNVGWSSLSGSTPSSIVARIDGGFDFIYGDHVLGYNAQGQQDLDTAFGVPTSNFATAVAPLASNGVVEVWLSSDDGQDGLATSIRVQWLAPDAPESRALQVAQDLDPWHTAFQLQAHADGTAAVLWSEGGGIFGAEYTGDAVGPAYAALAGDLTTTKVVETPGDKVGMAWLQSGDVWAQIFDPATGAVERADLGASNGDLSAVHALATAAGGLAVSWHQAGGAVVGSVLDAAGDASAPIGLPGDFLGVDAAGHAVTLHDQGGAAVMQTYALSSGLFWVG